MTYASISIDRREAYYERAASLIAADPLAFYCRAEAGRKVQANVKPKDLQPWTPERLAERRASKFAKAVAQVLQWRRA